MRNYLLGKDPPAFDILFWNRDTVLPWESAYNGARLFGGDRRFVLSSSGHVQAPVNPSPAPGAESRASYRVADALPDTAEEFLAQAPRLSGSWWYKAQAKAPGTYVLAN
jgi:poly(3-hydroxyalkanoate) synthetase